MIVLGIETSCDETAASVVRDGRTVVSNVVASQIEAHREYGGVVPEIASRAHERAMLPVLDKAIADAGIGLEDLDAIAIGHRPGLIGSILVGMSAAKALSWSLGVPLVGVDHVHAHLAAGFLGVDTEFAPALGVVISGGHTTIYRMDSLTELTRLGSTIDDAIGEAFDKAAAILGLRYPGGPEIDRLARENGADDRAVELPVSRLGRGSLDLSYSGLKTALLYAAKGKPAPPRVPGKPALEPEPVPELTPDRVRDLAASFQRAAVQALVLKIERALDLHDDLTMLVVGGGVSANSLVRSELARIAHERGLTLVIPAMAHCVDNAAMIASLGSVLFEQGLRDGLDLSAVPTTAC